MAALCPKCHTPQRPTAKFCRSCGVPLPRAASEPAAVRQPPLPPEPDVSDAPAWAPQGMPGSRESPASDRLAVNTPQERVLVLPWEQGPEARTALRPAPLPLRLQAALVDLLLALVGFSLAQIGAAALRQQLYLWDLALWGGIAAGLVLWGNHLILCGVRGQSVGMALVGIRIVRADGRPLSWGRSLLRHTLGYGLAVLPLGLGLLWMFVDGKGRGWHDILSGTWVVEEIPYGETDDSRAGSAAVHP